MTLGLSAEELERKALRRYERLMKGTEERLVSGSDDFTMILWLPEKDKKPQSEHRLLLHRALWFKPRWLKSWLKPLGFF